MLLPSLIALTRKIADVERPIDGGGSFGDDGSTINLVERAAEIGLPGASEDSPGNFGTFLGGIMGGIMAIAAILALLYLLWGALEWITSGGEKGNIEKARDKITQALVGLIILAATTALFMLIQQFLGICVLNLGGGCQ